MLNLQDRLATLSPQKRALIEKKLGQMKAEDTNSISPRARNEPPPLSFSQARLWFLDQFEPNTARYNVPRVLRLQGALDLEALRRALEAVVDRHEVLRTNYIANEGNPVQLISSDNTFPLTQIDLRDLDESDREARAVQICREEAARPFDLAHDRLIRGKLIHLGSAEQILFILMHHIVSDLWSKEIFARDLTELYDAFRDGRPSPLAPLPIQYADYAVWQRNWLRGEVLERQIAYWKDHLSNAPPLLELPTDRPRPAVATYVGAKTNVELSEELFERLQALSRSQGCTLFMTLLAAFNVLLARYSGVEDIVVGSPIANRNRKETEDLIGFFLNMLALRTDLSGNPSFLDLLSRSRDTAIGAFAHQDVPFEKLLEELQIERSLSHTPLFQVMFNLLNTGERSPSGTISYGILKGAPRKKAASSPVDLNANFDLTLYAIDNNGKLSLSLLYNVEIFEASTARQMLRHFVTLLGSIVESPWLCISDLSLQTEAETKELAAKGNRIVPTNPFLPFLAGEVEQSLPLRFEKQARTYPHNTAVSTRHHEWTYDTLDRESNRVAHVLVNALPQETQRIGLLFRQDAPLIASLLGVLKAGHAYVPLDPAYPAERLAYFLRDSGACAILTDNANMAMANALGAEHNVRVISVESTLITESSDEPVKSDATPDSLAYILYTSGSTGEPKGVMQNHRNVMHFIRCYTNNLHLTSTDRLTLFSSYGFDAAIMDIFGALLNGATLCPCETMDESVTGLDGWLRSQQVTVFHSTPTLYRYLTGTLAEQDRFPSVRLIVLGGEPAFERDLEPYRRHFSAECLLVNGLGPTELTVSLQYFLNSETRLKSHALPVGYAVDETQVLLLSSSGSIISGVGCGEITICSSHVAMGYWQKPELTRKAFLPTETDHVRMYRTGDRGRRNADGSIEFLGRLDQQVKLRGYRIELGEIEAHICRFEGIREAVVVAQEDGPGNKRLVAYVTAPDGHEVETIELREHLRMKLPEYMIPTVFVGLEMLPLTPNGKLDRKALPAPHAGSETGREYVAPGTPIEKSLAIIFCSLLQLERVGINDSFFDLGGHSLLATQVMSRIRNTFQVVLPIRAVFESPNVAGLAQRIEVAVGGEKSGIPPLTRTSREQPLPLSFAQQRLWFLDQFEPGNSHYNMPMAMSLAGAINVDALQQSLREMVRRHESLRTTFSLVKGDPVQVIREPSHCTLEFVDLSGLEDDQRKKETRRLVREEARRPFDLQKGPLFRAGLLQLGDEEHILLLTLHHIVSDGWSQGVLRKELSALYNGFAQGKPCGLPELPIQYADYATWQRNWLQGEALDQQIRYWKQNLEGAPTLLELPTDRPRPSIRSFRGALKRLQLPESLSHSLKVLGQREGSTLFMTLLAAFQVLLSRYSGQEDIVVGTPIANRTQSEIEGVIGCFFNTLALRGDLSGDPSFRELLSLVRETALGAYAHQDLPFEKLVEVLQPERSLSQSPLFQVMFILQNVADSTVEMEGLQIRAWAGEGVNSRFDLLLVATERHGRIDLGLEYSTDLFDDDRMGRLLGHLQTVLEGVAADPEQPISRLPLLTQSESHQIIVEWNDTDDRISRDCVHTRFEEQVRGKPHAVAIVFEDQSLTYAQLNELSNQLAHGLRKHGVGPETRVGVLVERSLHMVVCLLGILKAGGAYVPLDPSYPDDRLGCILEDAQPFVLLTQQHLQGRLHGQRTSIFCIDQPGLFNGESVANPANIVNPDNLAYVVFTSGSTGRPKGVQICHGHVPQLIDALHPRLDVTNQDVWTVFHSFAFDFSVWEIWSSLLAGGRLVITNADVTTSPEQLYTLLARERVTILNLTPSALGALMHYKQAADSDLPALHLRHLHCGGEALSREVAHAAMSWGMPVWNFYGPTELTVWASFDHVRASDVQSGSISVGRPFNGRQLYVLDRLLNPTPIGVPGELYIGGEGLARGYLGQPALTAERFISDPFSREPGARLYKTGDICRYLPDARIEFVGRIDHQVKIRGFRIELGEIENALLTHADVREAVVVARENTPGEKRLVAYVVGNVGDLNVTELREHLHNKLPAYMVPYAFVILECLPLTPNGKVDRKALPANENGGIAEKRYVAPRTPIEEGLAKIWCDLLYVERVGIHDNFFELGGHSLLAVRLVSEIRRLFGQKLPLQVLFHSSTIATISRELCAKNMTTCWATSNTVTPFRPGSNRVAMFCVAAAHVNALGYVALGRHLGADQPLFVLQTHYRSNSDRPYKPEELRELGAVHIEAMRDLQPEGPYCLGGMCEGAHIAFEMARQLQALGEDVSLLVSFDAWPEENTRSRFGWWLTGVSKAIARRKKDKRVPIGWVVKQMARLSVITLRPFYMRLLNAQASDSWEMRYWPGRSFEPPKFDGKMTVLRVSTQQSYRPKRRDLGWADWATRGVDIYDVPGKHSTLLREPHIQKCAGVLLELLNRIQPHGLPTSDGALESVAVVNSDLGEPIGELCASIK